MRLEIKHVLTVLVIGFLLKKPTNNNNNTQVSQSNRNINRTTLEQHFSSKESYATLVVLFLCFIWPTARHNVLYVFKPNWVYGQEEQEWLKRKRDYIKDVCAVCTYVATAKVEALWPKCVLRGVSCSKNAHLTLPPPMSSAHKPVLFLGQKCLFNTA